MSLEKKLGFLPWRYLVCWGDLGKIKGETWEIVVFSLSVSLLLFPSLSYILLCVVVLKVCSRDSLWYPRLFQDIHNLKILYKYYYYNTILKQY